MIIPSCCKQATISWTSSELILGIEDNNPNSDPPASTFSRVIVKPSRKSQSSSRLLAFPKLGFVIGNISFIWI